ncbi:MAG: hypothetical protein GC160_19795 [Acidobacteria bacterium]|nr:hypothetical protein [Acidobacteriota bacterium]
MPAEDITRLLDPAPKRYVGARLQQGRALVDSDYNEGRRADAQELQTVVREIVGAKATPDDGFLPDLKAGMLVKSQLVRFGSYVQAFVLPYKIRPGVLYVGGWRFEQEEAEPVVFQREYLQIGPATAPRAAVGVQRQLTYLRGWEQPVSAVEDSEVLEAAMQGADGGVRIRRMRQVETRHVDAADCSAAFDQVLEELGDGSTATYDAATCELRSNARLQMGFFGEASGDCEGCEPALRGKYLGGENHTIQLMLATPNSYVWAFDNGAPLYRAKLTVDADGGATVEMLTPPKDRFHEPVLNQVIEILPWSVLLENGRPTGGKGGQQNLTNERIAAPAGFFAEVDAPYVGGSRSFHARVDAASLSQIGISVNKGAGKSETKAEMAVQSGSTPAAEVIALEWDPSHPHAAELNGNDPSTPELETYVFLRLWHVKKAGGPLTIPISSKAPLGRTGLVPTFTGSGRRGDFWRATVRTAARDEILPLALMRPGGMPPDGPREVVAPLALVEWSSPFGVSHQVVSIHDCRPSLPAITQKGCCTYVVGTGSAGHFQSIQQAVDALPPQGGRICVLPGTYAEEIRIAGRDHVTLCGCGDRTILASPQPSAEALLDLPGSASHAGAAPRIVVESLSIQAAGQIGVLATGAGVELRDLSIETSPTGDQPTPSAVRALQAERLRLTDSRIHMVGGALSHHAAVYLDILEDGLLERNRIETGGRAEQGRVDAWGGVQIAGGSRRVELRGNEIVGGRGHGVTLGSARFRAPDGSSLGLEGAGLGQSGADAPFAFSGQIEPVERAGDNGETLLYYPEPEPAIEDLLLADNSIHGFRGSGVASLALEVRHDEVASGPPLCMRRTTFAVERAVLRDNCIERNARGLAGDLGEDRTRGGIILSEARRLDVIGNRIELNGMDGEAAAGPVCGVYVGFGEDVVIAENRIAGNGRLPDDAENTPGLLGGIVLRRPGALRLPDVTLEATVQSVRVLRNTVESPRGPALSMVAGGPCSVLANHFETTTRAGGFANGALTVTVLQPGRPWEAVDLPPNEPSPTRWEQPVGSQDYLGGRAQQIEATGGLIFSGNQITTHGLGEDESSLSVPVLIAATDGVVMSGNQLSAEAPRRSILAHCWVVGSTVNVSHNRIAEGIETTRLSLLVAAPMLTLAEDNILTHCPAVYGGLNHGNPLYFADEGNLHWFRMQNRRCESQAAEIFPDLQNTLDTLFGIGQPSGPNVAANVESRFVGNTLFRRFDS